MEGKHETVDSGKRHVSVNVLYSEKEISRFKAAADSLALPLEVSNASLVRTFSMMGLEAFERNQKKQQHQQQAFSQRRKGHHASSRKRK